MGYFFKHLRRPPTGGVLGKIGLLGLFFGLVVFYGPDSYGEEKLSVQLRKAAEKQTANQTPAQNQIFATSLRLLKEKKIGREAPKTGDRLPPFKLKNAKGQVVQLEQLLKNGPVVVVFYRGAWCPYCNLQLRAYQQHLASFRKAGGQVVAISPEKPDASVNLVKKMGFDFPVLTDTKNVYARRLHLAFKVDPGLKKLYLDWGIDLEINQGNENWELPVPATFVVDKKGMIAYSHINVDFTRRAEPENILAALQALK